MKDAELMGIIGLQALRCPHERDLVKRLENLNRGERAMAESNHHDRRYLTCFSYISLLAFRLLHKDDPFYNQSDVY